MKKESEENIWESLRIIIDILSYMNDEHKFGYYHNFNVEENLKCAEKLLVNKNIER